MKPKTEFSKKLLYVNYILVIIVIIASFVLMWKSCDLSPLGYIITGVFGEVTTATSFYYWKAKNENMIKIKGSGNYDKLNNYDENEFNNCNALNNYNTTETDIP